MSELITWLRVQLDKDEAEANKHPDGEDDPYIDIEARLAIGYPCEPYLRINKGRVLAEVAVKRALLDLHANDGDPHECAGRDSARGAVTDYVTLCATLRLLALPYAGREGWRDEWRPE